MKKNYFSKFYFFSKNFFLIFLKIVVFIKAQDSHPLTPLRHWRVGIVPAFNLKIKEFMEIKNQKSLRVLGKEHGSFDVVANAAGNHAAIFSDGFKAFVSAKAWELMKSSQEPDDFQYMEVKCSDGTWCPTICPRNKSNVLLHFSF